MDSGDPGLLYCDICGGIQDIECLGYQSDYGWPGQTTTYNESFSTSFGSTTAASGGQIHSSTATQHANNSGPSSFWNPPAQADFLYDGPSPGSGDMNPSNMSAASHVETDPAITGPARNTSNARVPIQKSHIPRTPRRRNEPRSICGDCGKSFSRAADRKRHQDDIHGLGKFLYVCKHPDCLRMRFCRKDKMLEHSRRMKHGGIRRYDMSELLEDGS